MWERVEGKDGGGLLKRRRVEEREKIEGRGGEKGLVVDVQ